jgi:hypothetical protein
VRSTDAERRSCRVFFEFVEATNAQARAYLPAINSHYSCAYARVTNSTDAERHRCRVTVTHCDTQ